MKKTWTHWRCSKAAEPVWAGIICLVALAGGFLIHAGLPEPWRFVAALPQGNDLLAAWSPGPDQLYAGGQGGVITHWNGTGWTRMATPTQKTVFGLHGRSATDIWAVGGDPYTDNITNRCLILRFDGSTWREFAAPQFSGYTYPFNAVHAIAANDVWATQDGGTYLAHYDGAKWDWVSVPLPVEGTFKAVTSVGPDHIYVAGTHGQILHRDHGVWKLEQKTQSGGFTTSILSALWAHSPEHVFAAGNWTQFLKRQPDGSWLQLPVGPSQPFGFGFLNIWGTSPTDVYLMDVQGVFHSDGVQPASRTSYEQSMRRQWLAACGIGDRLYGVGPGGVVHEYRLDGKGGGTLSPLSVGGSAELTLRMSGAVACGTEGIIVHGTSYQPDASPLWLLDGSVPRRWPTLPPGMAADTTVHAVVTTGLRDVVVAWENLLDWHRGVHRWDGQAWTAMPGADGAVALSRSPGGRLYAAAPYRVLYWNGVDAWVESYLVPIEQAETLLNALWAKSDTEVYAGARDGRMMRFDGSNWKTENTPSGDLIVGIAGTATDTYAVGENGQAWRRSGAGWQRLTGVAPQTDEHFTAIVAGADGVYAAQRTPGNFTGGGLGRLWRFSGATATLVIQGLSQPLEGLARTGEGHLVGIAPRDFIITTAPDQGATTMRRVDLNRLDWQEIGDSGVAVRAKDSGLSRPMMAVQRIGRPLPFASGAAGSADYGEHWLILEDRFYAGSAIPPMFVQVTYDPAGLAPTLAGDPLSLFRASSGVIEVPCDADALHHTLATREPVDFSAWTLGRATPPPSLAIGVSGAGKVAIAWPVAADGFELYSVAEISPNATWTRVTAPVSVNGEFKVVTVEVEPGSRFFRLAK